MKTRIRSSCFFLNAYILTSDNMKHILKYNYNLINPTIYKVNGEIRIKDGNEKYLFQPIKNIKELEEIHKLLIDEGLEDFYYKIIKTKSGKLYITYNSTHYVLLNHPKNKQEKIPKTYINNAQCRYPNIIKHNWKDLWIKKKEYIEQNIKNGSIKIKKEYEDIHEYYMFLAETAIAYISNVDISDTGQKYVISSKIQVSELKNNPVNIILDSEEREIAEKIKNKMLSDDMSIEYIEKEIENCIRTNLDIQKIYSRLIYPNYYYDLLETNLIKEESQIINLYEKIFKYENKIKIIYKMIKKRKEIKKIDWL